MDSNWFATRTRRVVAVVAAAGIVASLAACASDTTPQEEASGAFDWKRYEGETIEVLLNQHPWQQAIEPRIADFEELTGITVNVTTLPEDQLRQRVQVELSSQSTAVDVFMSGALAEGRLFAEQGWYEDLTPFVENASLTSDEYAFDDFASDVIGAHEIDGQLIGVPIQIETNMLFYRTDVLEQLGLEVPATTDELEDAAKAITEQTDLYGFTARGRGAAATSQLAPYLYGFGAEWNDGDGKAAFASDEGVEAFEYYGRMLREYGPSGAVNNSWQEVLPLFQQGQLAMFSDASVFATQLLDPEQSTVTDKVGFAPIPAGPEANGQAFWGWALGMSPFSEKKNAAWLFMQWASSPDVVAELQTEDGVAGARDSITGFPDTLPQEWVDAFSASRAVARSQHPTIAAVPEARDIIGNAVITAIEGGDVADAVEQAATDFDGLTP